MTEAPEKKVYTSQEVARITGFSDRHIRNQVAKGLIPGKKLFGRVRISKEALDRLIEQLAECGG